LLVSSSSARIVRPPVANVVIATIGVRRRRVTLSCGREVSGRPGARRTRRLGEVFRDLLGGARREEVVDPEAVVVAEGWGRARRLVVNRVLDCDEHDPVAIV